MPAKHNCLLRELVNASVNDQGVVEPVLVESVLTALREIKPARHREILHDYLHEIRKKLRLQHVEIELGCQASDSIVSELKNKIGNLTSQSLNVHVSTNDQLIAGYRVQLVDDVFEDSIHSRLSKLSHSLTS